MNRQNPRPPPSSAPRSSAPSALAPCSLLAGVALASAPLGAEPLGHSLDPAHTTVAFLVEHVGFADTLGRFTSTEGSFVWDPETRELSALRVVVDTASVGTDHEARDEHVRSDDFLDVEAHPDMIFELAGPVAVAEDGSAALEGELTLLGQTRPLTLAATLNKAAVYPFGHEKETLGVSARGVVQRSEYGMEYAVADGLVGDEVELIVEIEAIRD